MKGGTANGLKVMSCNYFNPCSLQSRQRRKNSQLKSADAQTKAYKHYSRVNVLFVGVCVRLYTKQNSKPNIN